MVVSGGLGKTTLSLFLTGSLEVGTELTTAVSKLTTTSSLTIDISTSLLTISGVEGKIGVATGVGVEGDRPPLLLLLTPLILLLLLPPPVFLTILVGRAPRRNASCSWRSSITSACTIGGPSW